MFSCINSIFSCTPHEYVTKSIGPRNKKTSCEDLCWQRDRKEKGGCTYYISKGSFLLHIVLFMCNIFKILLTCIFFLYLCQEPSVALAVQILDGTPLRPSGKIPMSVSQAKFEQKGRMIGAVSFNFDMVSFWLFFLTFCISLFSYHWGNWINFYAEWSDELFLIFYTLLLYW